MHAGCQSDLDLLQIQSTSLICFSLRDLTITGDPATSTTPITLPHLESLSFGVSTHEEPQLDEVLLVALRVSSLVRLALFGPSSAYEAAWVCLDQSIIHGRTHQDHALRRVISRS